MAHIKASASKRQNLVCNWSNEQTLNVPHKHIYWSSQRHHPCSGGEISILLLCATGDRARVYPWGAFAGLIAASLMPLRYVVLISVQPFRYSVLNLPAISLFASSASHLRADHSFQFPSVLLAIRYTLVSSTSYQNTNASVSQSVQDHLGDFNLFIYLFDECKLFF